MMKKRNVLVLCALITMGLSSCIKDGESYDPTAQYEIEKPLIEAYVEEYMPNAQYKDIEGYRIYFEVVEEGEPGSYQYKAGPHPNYPDQQVIIPSEAIVSYEGRRVADNTVFETREDQKFILPGNIIPAWQFAFYPKEFRYDEEGEPLSEPIDFAGGITNEGLQEGSVIRIVTPSVLAYRDQSQGSIPANSPLYFEISVSEIKDYESTN